MKSPEVQTNLTLLSTLAFTARLGPLKYEMESFPVWKRLAVRLTPRRYRWRWSEFAPLIGELLDTP